MSDSSQSPNLPEESRSVSRLSWQGSHQGNELLTPSEEAHWNVSNTSPYHQRSTVQELSKQMIYNNCGGSPFEVTPPRSTGTSSHGSLHLDSTSTNSQTLAEACGPSRQEGQSNDFVSDKVSHTYLRGYSYSHGSNMSQEEGHSVDIDTTGKGHPPYIYLQ